MSSSGSVESQDSFEELDRLVSEIKSIGFYDHTIPTNDQEQRQKFKEGEIDEPDFKYLQLDQEKKKEIDELWEQLGRASVPKTGDVKERVYRRTLDECAEILTIVENVDRRSENPELDGTLTGHQEMIFGELSEEAVEIAEEWLEEGYEGAVEDEGEMIPPGEVKHAFARRLREDDVEDDWEVLLYDDHSMRVDPASKEIYIPEERSRTEVRVENLLNHEYEGHAKRGINGADQPWGILSTGTGGFEPMSEGLAVYLEDVTDTLTEDRAQELAARTKAAELHKEGKVWRESYEILTKRYGVDENPAFTAIKRAKKAGGLQQGQVYLTGYIRAQDTTEGRDPEELNAGKISFEDVEQGLLEHPEI